MRGNTYADLAAGFCPEIDLRRQSPFGKCRHVTPIRRLGKNQRLPPAPVSGTGCGKTFASDAGNCERTGARRFHRLELFHAAERIDGKVVAKSIRHAGADQHDRQIWIRSTTGRLLRRHTRCLMEDGHGFHAGGGVSQAGSSPLCAKAAGHQFSDGRHFADDGADGSHHDDSSDARKFHRA